MKQLVERLRNAEALNSVLSRALRAAALGFEPATTAVWTDKKEGWHYELRLYEPLAPHGGIVVQVFWCVNQQPSVTAHYLDDLKSDYRRPEEARAIGALFAKRSDLELVERARQKDSVH